MQNQWINFDSTTLPLLSNWKLIQSALIPKKSALEGPYKQPLKSPFPSYNPIYVVIKNFKKIRL